MTRGQFVNNPGKINFPDFCPGLSTVNPQLVRCPFIGIYVFVINPGVTVSTEVGAFY